MLVLFPFHDSTIKSKYKMYAKFYIAQYDCVTKGPVIY